VGREKGVHFVPELIIPHLSPRRPTSYAAGDLQTSLFPSATLAEFYRFAVLLTGNAKSAEQVMADTLAEVEGQLSQFRNETSRRAWMAAHIRDRCLKNNAAATPAAPRLVRDDTETGERPAVLKIEAFLLAQRFHMLPEPERSALALFYLEFFTVEEIAELLKMDTHLLSDTLGAARQLLQQSLHGLGGQAS
jgi:DNA-directed RNA polymerase specialized sigma24 family protein